MHRLVKAAMAGPVIAALLAGCADDSDGDTTSGKAGSTAGADDGLEAMEASEILDAAQEALSNAESVRITGSIPDEGEVIDIDIAIDADAGATGSVTLGGQMLDLIVTPERVYIKGDDAFYADLGGDAAAQLLAGKWLSMPADDEDAKDLAQFADLEQFAAIFDDEGADVEKGDTGEIDGTPAIGLVQSNDTEPGVLWVASEGEPYPLRLENAEDESQFIDFRDYGEPVEITAPSSDEAIDLSQLENLGS